MKNRINIYGVISPSDWDFEREFISEFTATFPVQVAEALAVADVSKDLEIYIDSPGGYIDAGRSMIAMIEDWCTKNNRKCHVTVGGLAASMAAVMMVAFNGTISVHECSMVMFHAAKTAIWDDATSEELRDTASALDTFNAYAAKMIARRAGISEEEAATLIAGRTESFFGASDLITAHLADAILGTSEPAAPAAKLPSATAIRALAHKLPVHNDVGGLLAAVAMATVGNRNNQGALTMPEDQNAQASAEDPVTEEVVATTEETAQSNADAEKVDEASSAEETTPPAEESEEEETTEDPAPETEEDPATPAEESEEVTALRAALAQAQASEKAAVARAEAAENALAESKKNVVKVALTPPATNATSAKSVAVAWREAVRACGNNTALAKAKHPELFNALTK